METKTGDERRKFVATLTEMDKVLTEADANYKYFRNRGEDQRGIDYKRVAEREAKEEISSSLSSYARDEEEKKLADEKKRRDAAAAAAAKAAAEAAKVALGKKLKDPAFLYPNRNICASSIKLYKDWKSGTNRFAILNKEVVNEPERLKLRGVEKRFFGIVDKTDMTGIKGRLTYIYGCGNEKKGAHAALIGVIIRPSDKTMTNDFIQKYRREMPKAKIRQFSKTVSKRNFQGWFERSVIEHVTVFQDGVKVVRVTRTETKTTYSKGFFRCTKEFQESKKVQYYKEERKTDDVGSGIVAAFEDALGIDAKTFAEFFNSANYDCNVKIYDEMQLNAYAKIRDASDQEAATEKRKARQKKLDF